MRRIVARQLLCRYTSCLDERLLLLAREAAEAVEALTLAITVVEAAVRAFGELREVAEVRVAVGLHLGNGVHCAAR